MSIERETTREDWDRLRKQFPAIETPIPPVEARGDYDKVKGMTPDMVNHPSHYTYGKVECIDAIEESMTTEAFRGYCKGAALKYLWRYERKGKPLEDLQKAQWYLVKLISSHQQQWQQEALGQ